MSSQYARAVELNAKLVPLVVSFQAKENAETLQVTFDLLSDTTNQVCWRTIEKLSLSRDVIADMRQEAFLKWRAIIQWYDETRCPVVLSWWRTCLRNHLLSMYYSRVRSRQLYDDEHPDHSPDEPLDRLFVEELREQYLAEFTTWKKDRSKVPLATAILNERLLVVPGNKTPQKELVARFKLSQGYISRWEDWLRDRIRSDHQYMQEA